MTFIVSANTYALLVDRLGLDAKVDYRREYEVELDGIGSEEELLKSLSQ